MLLENTVRLRPWVVSDTVTSAVFPARLLTDAGRRSKFPMRSESLNQSGASCVSSSVPILAVMASVWLGASGAQAQVVINEVFENPPGIAEECDARWEYIELYGEPGFDLTGSP